MLRWLGRHRSVVAVLATFGLATGCGMIAGVDFDQAHLAPEAGVSPQSTIDGGGSSGTGPQNGDGGNIINPGEAEAGTVLDGGSTSSCTPDPSSVTCAGACGTVKDNCGADRVCPDCGGGQACNGGKCQCTSDPNWCKNRCGSLKDNCGKDIVCPDCGSGLTCKSNSCGCAPDPVTTTCAGKQCGTAVNNCGQTVSCGSGGQCTSASAFCKSDGTCCTDNGAACAGKCGGVQVVNNCGQAIGCPQGCSAGGVCQGTVCCQPEALSVTCAGLPCGPATNNCGQTVTCPDTCQPPQTCGGGGTSAGGDKNKCGCTKIACPVDQCAGDAPDGCGGTQFCHARCSLDGQCPCAGGSCQSKFCVCKPGPCL